MPPSPWADSGEGERTVQFVRDNFMVGRKYNSLADLNGQALAWCNKVNGKVHATASARSALPCQIAPASLGCDLAFVRIVKPNRNPTKWFRFGEEEQRSGASHTQKGVASGAKFVLARQSWPSITCCPRITRGRRSLCTGYRARETMGPPQKRPSTLFCIIAL